MASPIEVKLNNGRVIKVNGNTGKVINENRSQGKTNFKNPKFNFAALTQGNVRGATGQRQPQRTQTKSFRLPSGQMIQIPVQTNKVNFKPQTRPFVFSPDPRINNEFSSTFKNAPRSPTYNWWGNENYLGTEDHLGNEDFLGKEDYFR